MIPEIRLVVCANAADNADNGWLGITDVWLVTTDRFECDAIIISCARAGRAGGVLSISIDVNVIFGIDLWCFKVLGEVRAVRALN